MGHHVYYIIIPSKLLFNNVVEKTKGRFGREGHGLFYTPGGGGGEVKGEGVSTPSMGGEKGGGLNWKV